MPYATNSDGSISFPLREVFGLEAVATKILTRLRTVRGEWPTDTALGLPWLAWLENTPSQAVVEAAVRDQLRRVEGVLEVRDLLVGIGLATTIRATVVAELDGEAGTLELGTPGPYASRGAPQWYRIGGPLRRGSPAIV